MKLLPYTQSNTVCSVADVPLKGVGVSLMKRSCERLSFQIDEQGANNFSGLIFQSKLPLHNTLLPLGVGKDGQGGQFSSEKWAVWKGLRTPPPLIES